jgi:hypothetical protein
MRCGRRRTEQQPTRAIYLMSALHKFVSPAPASKAKIAAFRLGYSIRHFGLLRNSYAGSAASDPSHGMAPAFTAETARCIYRTWRHIRARI